MRKLSFMLLLLLISGVGAQELTCDVLIQEALYRATELCLGMGTDEVCYGNNLVEVETRAASAAVAFDTPGDVVALPDIQTIRATPLNVESGDFGVALLRARVEVPGSLPGQIVTFLMVGDVALQDTAEDGDTGGLRTFVFSTGIGQSRCNELDYDTLIVDGPDNVEITFTLNGADVRLGSTAVFTAAPGGAMEMLLLDGAGEITANGATQVVEAGEGTLLTLGGSDGLTAASAPAEPEEFPPERVAHLPTALADAGQNVALGKPVRASNALPTDPPENVVNGITSGADNWNAGDLPPPQFIEIDLQQTYTVSQILLQTSQFPPAEPTPTVHQLYVGDASGRFTLVNTFAQETRDDEWLIFAPTVPIPDVRFVQVVTQETIHWVSWGEIQVIAAGIVPQTACVIEPPDGNVNLRAAPDASAQQTGVLERGQGAYVIGQTVGADGLIWWQTTFGSWVRSDVVAADAECVNVPRRGD